jgi:hypothetical protein
MHGDGIHPRGTVHPSEGALSSALATTDQAATWARRLEDRRADRVGCLKTARRALARETGVSAGTFENLRRSRIKSVATWVSDRLRYAVIRELEAEVRALEHELAILRQTGSDPRSFEMGEVETHLAAARLALGLPSTGARA